ncbi:HAD-IA family hydrolase [Jannaschia sp. S6380]|uniref:HAD family hydrolase n=1 Tax=Jannaschia sp. S6380 TaxID=2926408 RepID=UPI001FF0E0F0|nr:HAD-IA family hydrolase [Jannaschia sp. S6380]MCK0168678.1 HAD-IA family hydrolase [Jannaschia sp. S6380]
MSAIRAVVFDIGNVLIEWQPERFYDREIGPARRREMFAAVDLHGMNDCVDLGHGFRDVIYAEAERIPAFAAEIRMWHDRWLELASPVIERSVRLMRALRRHGIPVHALTNFGIESFDLAARNFDFLREFDQTFVSGHLGIIKPDPGIFAAVEDGLGLPGGALLFADDRAANVAAAAARGWQVHHFTTPDGWADRLVAEGLLTSEEAA